MSHQYELLQRGIAHQKQLERMLLEERGLGDIVRALATTVGGTVAVLGPRGETLGARTFHRELRPDVLSGIAAEAAVRSESAPSAFAPAGDDLAARALALPVITGTRRSAEAWLVAVRDVGGLGDFERLILQQAVTVVALELMRRRAMRDTERRLAGDVLAEALRGTIDADELERRLRPFGIGHTAAVLVFSTPDPHGAEALDEVLREAGVPALVATREALLCAVVGGDADPLDVARRAREALVASGGAGVRAAASRTAAAVSLRRSFHEARCALEASAIAAENGGVPPVASYRDLGAYELLLSLQDDEALRLYCDSVLDPLESSGGEYGDELLRSLEAFLEHNGQWERAARALYCHRHTLRYRIKRVEQLTGRDLGRARDRIEFWLALRGRELLR